MTKNLNFTAADLDFIKGQNPVSQKLFAYLSKKEMLLPLKDIDHNPMLDETFFLSVSSVDDGTGRQIRYGLVLLYEGEMIHSDSGRTTYSSFRKEKTIEAKHLYLAKGGKIYMFAYPETELESCTLPFSVYIQAES